MAHKKKIYKKPVVVINAASGSTTDISDDISIILRNYLNVEPACHFIDPEDLVSTLKQAVSDKADLIITYGGDGTSMAAMRIANPNNIPVIPLPGGTMNLLPKALYDSVIWADVLENTFEAGTPAWIPAGEIEDHKFVVAAIFGNMTQLGQAREMIRERNFTQAIIQVANTFATSAQASKLRYDTNNGISERTANLLQLTCPFMNPHAVMPNVFEVASVDIDGFVDISNIGLNAIVNDWRASEKTHISNARDVILNGKGQLDALLDGEPVQLTYPIKVTFRKKGALVIC